MPRTTTTAAHTQRTALLRLSLAAVALTTAAVTVTRQAPAQEVFASADGARSAGAAESAAPGTSGSASSERTTGALNFNLWTGNVRGDVTGHATAMLERVGPPEDALDPVYPVLMRWTVESPQNGRSFAAELFGTIDGGNECMHLGGIITDGWKKGAEVQVDCLSTRKGGQVALRILPTRAAR